MDNLIEDAWYWVRVEGDDVRFPALYNTNCAGGWTNYDTWEDFDNSVVEWALIPTIHDIRLQQKEIK